MAKLLLAVSGGIDSMYMAWQFLRAEGADGIAVAHCNFNLRGEESDGDQEFVKDWCALNGVEFFSKGFDTAVYASEQGVSIEMAARDLRYSWFAQLCREHGFKGVAVAHNADDNAETLLLNLLRGTGGRGLRGMAAEGTVPGAGDVKLFRPLLDTTRQEIAEWMQENGCPYRNDRTNAQSIYKRNKLRNQVFPYFREINPSFVKTFARDMKHFAQEDTIADEWYRENRGKVFRDGVIDIPALLALGHWEYMLYRLTEPYGFNLQNLEAVTKFLSEGGNGSGKTFYGNGWMMVSTSDSLIIREIQEDGELPELLVEGPGEYVLGRWRLTVRVFDRAPEMQMKQPAGVMIADAGALGFPFTLRGWRDGDWLNPIGLKGRKKLSDLFVDLKFPLPDKRDAVILETDTLPPGHVGALVGYRTDESLKVTEHTARIIEIKLEAD